MSVLGQMDNKDGTFESQNRVYDRKGICPTIQTCQGGGREPKVVRGYGGYIVASRGRENGQEYEARSDVVTNTLTTVGKDNYVVAKVNKCKEY